MSAAGLAAMAAAELGMLLPNRACILKIYIKFTRTFLIRHPKIYFSGLHRHHPHTPNHPSTHHPHVSGHVHPHHPHHHAQHAHHLASHHPHYMYPSIHHSICH